MMTNEKQTYRYKDYESYKIALSRAPQSDWVKGRSIGGGKSSAYISIPIKQALADYVFRDWSVIDERYMNVLNEVVCTVKLQALPDYPGADDIIFTGSASKPVQQDKGVSAEHYPKGKKGNALEYCLPAVRSEAIGNALSTIGNIFGRNIGRNEVGNDFSFDVSYEKPKEQAS